MFENPRRGRQGRNFTTNAPKILGLNSSSEQIFSRKLPLGAPDSFSEGFSFCQDDRNKLAFSRFLSTGFVRGCLQTVFGIL